MMKKVMMACSSVLFLLLPMAPASAGDFKFRAREHLDVHTISVNDGSDVTYQGLSNTLNLWWEEPKFYSIGLAFNPLLGSAKLESGQNAAIGNEIKLITLGLEGKYYHRDISANLFSRLGVGYARLESGGSSGDLEGYHAYIGAGWEFDVKGVGIALELAFRHSRLEQDVVVDSLTPSFGVHFYR